LVKEMMTEIAKDIVFNQEKSSSELH
jgi:hypothetical protein